MRNADQLVLNCPTERIENVVVSRDSFSDSACDLEKVGLWVLGKEQSAQSPAYISYWEPGSYSCDEEALGRSVPRVVQVSEIESFSEVEKLF